MNYHTACQSVSHQKCWVSSPVAYRSQYTHHLKLHLKKNHKFSTAYPDLIPIPLESPVALEPSRWCVHMLILMPSMNTSYCFQDEYGQSHTDNNNQIFGVHKNETAIHFSSVPLLWSASKISIAYDSIYLSRIRRWFLWRTSWIFVIQMGESFSNGWIKISGCTISSSEVGKPCRPL